MIHLRNTGNNKAELDTPWPSETYIVDWPILPVLFYAQTTSFLEMYTKDDAVVLASFIPSSWIFWATENPVTFAGTYWYYTYYHSYLYAKGPLTEPAIMKVLMPPNFTISCFLHYRYSTVRYISSINSFNLQIFQRGDFDNTGIHFVYSLPKSGRLVLISGIILYQFTRKKRLNWTFESDNYIYICSVHWKLVVWLLSIVLRYRVDVSNVPFDVIALTFVGSWINS